MANANCNLSKTSEELFVYNNIVKNEKTFLPSLNDAIKSVNHNTANLDNGFIMNISHSSHSQSSSQSKCEDHTKNSARIFKINQKIENMKINNPPPVMYMHIF